MKVHPAFNQNLMGLLIRDEWNIMWDCVEKNCADGVNNFIIIGQPGIEKTLSLYYFLARRLALGLTTFFQDVPDYVWLFNESGVRPIPSNLPWSDIDGLSEGATSWALVDSNWEVKGPASFLISSPFFVVQAASPRDERWGWEKYHGMTEYFYMNPFSLNEMFQGNSVQLKPSKKDDLRYFIKYGPSARECYNATSMENGLGIYLERLHRAVARMSWAVIDDVVTEGRFDAKPNDDTSYLVVLLLPSDDSRCNPHATVITRTILRILWKKHREALKYQSMEFSHIFSTNRETSVSAGWLFEAIVHDLLEDGIDVFIAPMIVEQDNHTNAINDKHVASKMSTKRWKSSAMAYMPYIQNDGALVIKPLHYYVPVDPCHPTYDSFTFEFTPCASYEGPILNPKNKEIYDKAVLDKNSNIGLFTIFQITIGAEHSLDEKSLDYICMVADQNKFHAIGIRYIGIIPVGKETSFKMLVAWRNKLDTYSMSTTLYQLPPTS